MGIYKQKIDFDTSAPTENDRVGAFVLASDGSLIAATSNALHVNIQNASLAVTATALDIRALTNADVVTAEQGTSPWVIGDGGGSITVDGTVSVNIASEIAEDSAIASGAGLSLQGAYRQDTLATDTSADGDASFIKVNAKGEQYVIDTDANASLVSILADTAAMDTNLATLAGAVAGTEMQVDVLTLPALPAGANQIGSVVITDGVENLVVNSDGSLNVVISESSGDGAIKATVASVTGTAAEVVATPLTGRDEVVIQNLGNVAVYIGHDNTVGPATASIELPKYSSISFRADENTNIWMEAASGTQDVRILEIAY